MADAFRTQVLQNKDTSAAPVVTLGSCTFLHTREVWFVQAPLCARPSRFRPTTQNNVYVMLLTQGNSNAAAAFRLLRQVCLQKALAGVHDRSPPCSQIIALFKNYFDAFDEESLRNNFVLIYELLDGAGQDSSLCSLPADLPPPQRSWTTGTPRS
jgi:AP-2 complex subunit mu-1